VLQAQIQAVKEVYDDCEEIKATALELGLAELKVRKLLITGKLRPAVEAVANLVLNIVLVKYFGVAGVLMATIVTMLIINTYWGAKTLFNTYFKRSMKEYFINLLLYLVITTFAVAVTYGICQLFAFTGIVRLLYNMLICCIVPNVVYLLCYRSNKNFRYTLQLLKRLLD